MARNVVPTEPKMEAALDELRACILAHFPQATFRVVPSPEERGAVHLKAMVDVEDTDAVIDLIIDRMMQFQIDEGLPLYVVPVRTPERIAAMVAARERLNASRM
ncbi:MAG: hypothetical protein AB7P40_24240 [Chloroflexota bacterium]